MRKLLLPLFAAMAISSARSQVLFYEDFDGIPGLTSGGAGTYSFPAGWLLANVDNQTPDASVSYVNAAWTRREDFATSVADSAAFSNSYYSPAGTSNDWMVTPAIGPLPASTVLSWNAVAYDPAYSDGYEVRIMTTPPTGGTGVIGNLLTSSTVLFSTTAESNSWTARSVSLSAYTGQTVYIAFRNNSVDKFLLLIDDVKLEAANSQDAKLVSLDTVPEYTIIPKTQVYNMPTAATVLNDGFNALTNVALKLNVYNGALAPVYSNTGTALPSLAPGASASVSAGSYAIPSTPDTYYFEYVITHDSTDDLTTNDTLLNSVVVHDSTYARDNGVQVGTLGIGAGMVGYLGQSFWINTPALLSSVTYKVNLGYTGRKTAAVLWDMAAGTPNAIVASTDTILYPDDSARVYTLPIHGGDYLLAPGNYAVTLVEFDSTLALVQTSDIFRTGTTWVNWPSSPLGGWGNNEDFGASFAKSFQLRLNLNPDCSGFLLSTTSTATTCVSCTDGSATANVSGATGAVSYAWLPSGGTAATASGLSPGTYTVTVTDDLGCSSADTVTVASPDCSALSASATSTNASCGTCADGSASVSVTGATGSVTYSWSPAGGTGATATGLLPGTYTVVATDSVGCMTSDTVVVNFSTGIDVNTLSAATSIYPNPGVNVFTIHIPSGFAEEVLITVSNYLGETVYTKAYNSFGDQALDLSSLAAGKYTISFTSTKYVVNKTFTIIR